MGEEAETNLGLNMTQKPPEDFLELEELSNAELDENSDGVNEDIIHDKPPVELLSPSSAWSVLINITVLSHKSAQALKKCGHSLQILTYNNTKLSFCCQLCNFNDWEDISADEEIVEVGNVTSEDKSQGSTIFVSREDVNDKVIVDSVEVIMSDVKALNNYEGDSDEDSNLMVEYLVNGTNIIEEETELGFEKKPGPVLLFDTRKVRCLLDSLKEEGEDVVKELDSVTRLVNKCGETAVSSFERLSSCVEADIKKMYPLTSQELEVVDEQITIIKATLFNNTATGEEEEIVEENWKDKFNLSSSSNYILRKMKKKLSSLQRDMKMLMLDIINLQNRVRDMLQAGQFAAKKLYDISDEEQHKMLKVYKEVSKVVGSSDMEITLLKVSISSLEEGIKDVGEDKFFEVVQEKEVEKRCKTPSQQCGSSHVNMEDTKVNEGSSPCKTSEDVVDKGDEADLKVNHNPGSELKEIQEIADVDNFNLFDRKTMLKHKLTSVSELNTNNMQVLSRVREGLNRQIVKSRARVNKTSVQPVAGAEKISTLVKVLEKSGTVSNCNMLDKYRCQHLEQVKKRLGEYGEPLMVGEYKQLRMMFDSGCPAMFWLFANTGGLYDLQDVIQRKLSGKQSGDGGGEVVGIGVGSMVLARYSVDKAVYRAKVEEVIEGELFSVRYIDYGNRDDTLTKDDIYPWDEMLEIIPPQAVPCCFYKASEAFSKKTSLNLKEMEAFTLLMKQSSPMQMVVLKRNNLPLDVFNPSVHQVGPELVVSVRGKDGRDVLHKLSKLPAFAACFGQKTQLLEKVQPKVEVPTVKAIKQLEALQQHVPMRAVPHPLHLDDAVLAHDVGDNPPSPVHPMFTSRAVDKVMSWLERDDSVGEDVRDSLDQPLEEPGLAQHQLVDLKPTVDEDGLRKPFKIASSDLVIDIKPVLVEEEEYTLPTLAWQQVEEDQHGEFQFMVSHIMSPEEMYLQPVSEISGQLAQLEVEMGRIAGCEKLARVEEVVVGSVWTVLQEMWYRVRVNAVYDGQVELQSIDYGHYLHEDHHGHHLHRLPPGLASTLPGLAVRCHLSRVRPVQDRGWDKLAMQMINSCLEGVDQHTALVVERNEAGSVGVVITLERQGKFSTVNQRLVEVGCAVSSLFGSYAGTDEVGDSGLVNDWDPLEDYNSTINNYVASGRRSKASSYVPG